MNQVVANKLRGLPLSKRQDLLLRNPRLSDQEPDQQALEALAALHLRSTGGGDAA